MKASDKLLKNTFIYTIGNLGSKILSFLLVPLYTFYLSKSDFGYYDLILTSVSLLVPFVTVQISDATYRWLLDSGNDEQKQRIAISNGLFILLFNSIIFFAIFFIISAFVKVKYVYILSFIVLLNSFFPFFQQVVRGLGKNKLYSLIGIINTFLVVVFNVILLMVFKLKLSGVLMAIVLAYFVSTLLIVYLGKLHKFFSKALITKKECLLMVKYSWPLIPNLISWWMINEVNRFIILFQLGADSNGIFALSNRFPAIMIIFNSIFILSWQDHAISSHADEDKDKFYSKIFNIYVSLELSLVIFLTVISKYVVNHFVGNGFRDAWRYMPILYLSVAFSSFSSFLGVGYLGAKKTFHIFTTTIVGSVANIIISMLFIKSIGLYAPALGTAVGFFLMWLVRTYQTKEFYTIKIQYFNMLSLTAIFVAVVFLIGFVNVYLQIGLLLVSLVVLAVYNKILISYLYNFLMKRFQGDVKTELQEDIK